MTTSLIEVAWRRLLRGCAMRCAPVVLAALAGPALAGYGKTPASTVDSAVTRIDEKAFLGASVDADYALQDSFGRDLVLGDLLSKPLILVLSYYSCDGACSAINQSLHETLQGVSDWRLGRDYRVLTVSFDPRDTRDNLNMFVKHAGFRNGVPDGWTVALLKNASDIGRLTGSIGFRYFWEPRDRVFLHPAVYAVLSPEARVTRFLYAGPINASDLSMSITGAYGNEVAASNVVNYLVSACYSYNYHDGKYTLSIPLFIAFGTLGFGLSCLLVGTILMKRRGQK